MGLAASLVLPALAFGQLFPLYAAACFAAAYFAQRGSWVLAGAAASASLVEPHLGLPVWCALIVWNRDARVPAVAGAAVLAAVSVAFAGTHECFEYVTAVLPLHARSELASDAQLSLAAILHAWKAPDALALRLGTLSYGAVTVCSVWFARAAARRFADPAFVVAVPAAFAGLGGTFMHATEMFAAIPLALLLAVRVHRVRALALCALVLLCVPWYSVLEGGIPFAFPMLAAIPIFYVLWQTNEKRLLPAFACALAACALLLCAPGMAVTAHAGFSATGGAIDAAYPQAGWQALNESLLSSGALITWILRGGSWLGLLALALAGVYSLTSIDVRSNST